MHTDPLKTRLNKYLANAGIASRRKVEDYIRAGRVSVNGEITTNPATGIDPFHDEVYLDGRKVEIAQKFAYYAVYKPRGYVSTVEDPHAEKKVVDLVPPEPRVYPVGRLDKESEGLMILTDDGDLAQTLTHPKFEHEKEYLVTVESSQPMTEKVLRQKVERMRRYEVPPKLIEIVHSGKRKAELRVILAQGKKRQIRLMCASADLSVVRLIRIRIAKLHLADMKPGSVRIISRNDIV